VTYFFGAFRCRCGKLVDWAGSTGHVELNILLLVFMGVCKGLRSKFVMFGHGEATSMRSTNRVHSTKALAVLGRRTRASNHSNNKARRCNAKAGAQQHSSPLFLLGLVMLNCCATHSRLSRMPLLFGCYPNHFRSLPCCRERAGDERVACTNAILHEPKWS
jgi:hypothetical protein